MSRRFSLVTVVLAVAALAAAGCGSSSKSKTANQPVTTPPAPQTPSTPSTGTGTTPAPSNVLPGKLSSSTPIGSPTLRDALVKKLASVKAIPAKDDAPIADCVVKKLESQGVKTYGEANQRLTDVRNDAETCTRQVLAGG